MLFVRLQINLKKLKELIVEELINLKKLEELIVFICNFKLIFRDSKTHTDFTSI